MDKFVNWYTFLAFVAGVLLSATVKHFVASAKGSLGG